MAGKNIELIDKRNKIYVETGAEMSLATGELGISGQCTFVGQREWRIYRCDAAAEFF